MYLRVRFSWHFEHTGSNIDTTYSYHHRSCILPHSGRVDTFGRRLGRQRGFIDPLPSSSPRVRWCHVLHRSGGHEFVLLVCYNKRGCPPQDKPRSCGLPSIFNQRTKHRLLGVRRMRIAGPGHPTTSFVGSGIVTSPTSGRNRYSCQEIGLTPINNPFSIGKGLSLKSRRVMRKRQTRARSCIRSGVQKETLFVHRSSVLGALVDLSPSLPYNLSLR